MKNSIIKPAFDALDMADNMIENLNKHIDEFNAKYHIDNPRLPPRKQYIVNRQSPSGIYYNGVSLYDGREIQYPADQNTGMTIISRSNVLGFMGIKS